MKRITFLIMLIVQSNGVYGMERVKEKKCRTFICFMIPEVVVVQDDIYDRYTKNADITIFGEIEQIALKKGRISPTPLIERMLLSDYNSLMKRNNQLYFVKEPQLFFAQLNAHQPLEDSYIYEKTVCNPITFPLLEKRLYRGGGAIEEALKDLGHCYDVVLRNTHKYFTQAHRARSIALSQLSGSLGIPGYKAAHVAISSVVEFITNNFDKNKYGLIELVVKDSYSFKLYRKLLIEHATLIKKKDCFNEENYCGHSVYCGGEYFLWDGSR